MPTYTTAFSVNRADLEFILRQIQLAESTSAAYSPTPLTIVQAIQQAYGVSAADAALLPYGLRTVDGSHNNLLPGRTLWGAADQLFPRLTAPRYRDDADGDALALGPSAPPLVNGNYGQPGSVVDADPRTISNLIVSMTVDNPAAVEAFFANPLAVAAFEEAHGKTPVRPGEDPGANGLVVTDADLARIPNQSPDVGLTAGFNSWMTYFGQFFDHGLDLVTKGGNGAVFIPLQPDDPLYNPAPGAPNFMVLTRATPTLVDGVPQHTNTTTSYVDQNQTYTSHPSHQVFLREYARTPGGEVVSTGRLLDGTEASGSVHGAPANWKEVKAQALEMLGIRLSDHDVHDVPLLATDQYGKFIPGPNGYAQLVMAPDAFHATSWLQEGSAAGITTAGALRTGHAFLDDIANHASPGAGQVADADVDVNGNGVYDPGIDILADVNGDGVIGTEDFYANDRSAGTYDDEMLGSHFVTGDGRGNENAALTAVHSIFHSEHNRLADAHKATILATGDRAFINEWLRVDLGPQDAIPTDPAELAWDGERIFQAARFVTEMQYQHLVFEEFGRRIQPMIDPFVFNNSPQIDPSIVAEFAHTVYRFGHSMLTNTVDRLDNDLNVVGGDTQSGLVAAFLNPQMYLASGQDAAQINAAFIRGLTRDLGNEIDEFLVEDLRSALLGLPLDLGALNIARGRETGVPSLNETRAQLHAAGAVDLVPYTSWIDFAGNLKNPMSIVNFIAAYGTHASIEAQATIAGKRDAAMALAFGTPGAPADRIDFLAGTGAYAADLGGLQHVDLWIGGLAERLNEFGGMLGQTFNWIFEHQMEQLQFGDRFYYLSRTQGMNLLNQLEASSFTDLVMRNSALGNVHSTHLGGQLFATPDIVLELDRGIAQADPDPVWAPGEAANLLVPKVTRSYSGVQVTDPVTGKVHDVGGSIQFRGGEHVVIGGTEGNDRIVSDKGDDTLWGDGGNDYLNGGQGADSVHGGDGDDIIEDPFGDDMLRGERGDDVVVAANGLDLLFGGEGRDFLMLGADASEIFGGEGDDFILGGAGSDFLLGNEGNDWMEGGSGFDTLAGDNSELFFNSALVGHDVLFNQGDEGDYDAESGDDIMGSGPSVFRYEGMFGFDWAIAKHDLAGVDFDMRIPIFTTDPADILRDRFDLVEGFSGWRYNDRLAGDDRGQTLGGLPTGEAGLDFANHLLTAEGIARIDGMAQFLGGALPTLLGEGATGFRDGNILIGGGGSDTLLGRGGNDILDGDAWLNVRIAIHARNPDGSVGAVLYTAESLSTDKAVMGPYAGLVFAAGTDLDAGGTPVPAFGGRPLTALLRDGTIHPGQLRIVREMRQAPEQPSDIDTAVYQGTLAEYEIEGLVTSEANNAGEILFQAQDLDGDGFIRVRDLDDGLNGAQIVGADGALVQLASRGIRTDGTDLLRGIERLQFADATLVIGGSNGRPTGDVAIGDATPLDGVVTPHVGQVLTVAAAGLADPDGGPVNLRYEWQTALAVANPTWTTVASGPSYTVRPGDTLNLIRAVAVFEDGDGVTERIVSAATAQPTALLTVAENSPAGTVVVDRVPLPVGDGAPEVDLAVLVHRIDPAFSGGGRFTVVEQGVDPDFNPRYAIVVADGAAPLDFEAPQAPVDNQVRIVVNTWDGDPDAGGTLVLRQEFTIALGNVDEGPAAGAAAIVDGNGGPLREGDVLTVSTAGIADPDGIASMSHLWQWSEDGSTWTTVAGGYGPTLAVPDAPGMDPGALAGRQLRVLTTVVDGAGAISQVTSTPTAPVGMVWQGAGGDDVFAGTAGADLASGGAGSDLLDGGAGEDVLAGGAGDDIYVVRDTGDQVVEAAGEGIDTVASYATSFTLGAHVEHLSLFGPAVTGIGNDLGNWIGGNDLVNVLQGGGGDDILVGGLGADTVAGGAGNDGYVINGDDDSVDTIVELAGEGDRDWVNTNISYTLADHVEILILLGAAVAGTGNDQDNWIGGNALFNLLRGRGGNDVLDGGFGDDTMEGGTGDDLYWVESAGDTVTELAGEGNDSVASYVDWTLGAHLENLSLLGSAVSGTGNDLANWIGGNALDNVLAGGGGDDVLLGGAGADTMTGGTGNDGYVVDDAADVVVEAAGEGRDWVNSSLASTTLWEHVEDMDLVGAAVSGTGNGLDNLLRGNALDNVLNGLGGNDVLDGGFGNDTMAGGQGDDLYWVESAGDAVVELAGEGTDTVASYVSHVLGANVENLSLLGDAFLGSGNGLSNWIAGTAGANLLEGEGGDDVLQGGGGNDRLHGGDGNDILEGGDGDDGLIGSHGRDVLTGGAGADTFTWILPSESLPGALRDLITDFVAGTDKIRLSGDWNTATPGIDGFTFIGDAAFSAAGQLRVGSAGGNTLLEADLDGDGVADFELELAGTVVLAEADFIL